MDILLENLMKVVVAAGLILAGIVGSYSGSFVASTAVPADTTLGAVAGPDRYFPRECANGVCTNYASIKGMTSSTTICSIKSPSATSTLTFGSLKVLTGTSTTVSYELGKSTVPDATTTRLAYDLAVTGQTTIVTAVGSTTDQTAPNNVAYTDKRDDLIFAPNTYFNVKYGGLAAGNGNGITNASCQATFVEN